MSDCEEEATKLKEKGQTMKEGSEQKSKMGVSLKLKFSYFSIICKHRNRFLNVYLKIICFRLFEKGRALGDFFWEISHCL